MAENILINGAVYTDVESIRLKNTYGNDVNYGITPHIGEDHNWYIGNHDTGIRAEGRDGTSYMSAPLFANSEAECTDTSKLYVLPDGYIYAYKLISKVVEGSNKLVPSTATLNKRLSGSSGSVSTAADSVGSLITDFIPVSDMAGVTPYEVRLNWEIAVHDDNKVVFFDSSKTRLMSNMFPSGGHANVIVANGETVLSLKELYSGSAPDWSNVAYLRFQLFVKESGTSLTSSDVTDLTVRFDHEKTTTTSYQWTNTGHAFVPADYEDRIIGLEEDVSELKNISESGASSASSVAIPSYWEAAVINKTECVKALQTEGGASAVSFIYASDTHIPDNDNGRTDDIGKVMARMLDNCEIPFAVITGDVATRASFSTEEEYLVAHGHLKKHLAPLWGTDRLLIALGNHDGCYGDSSGYYRKQFSPERMWQEYFRSHALDFRRVFSKDGLYYYVDNIPQKTRFIVLNSNYAGEYAVNGNGFAVNNRFGTSCYGQAQLDWLCGTALDMPEGYGALIFTHVPPNATYNVDRALLVGIIDAYNGKKAFTGSYTAGVDGWSNSNINVNFADAKGEVIAVVAGHVHGDSVDTDTASCPVITVLAAGASANEPYDESAPARRKWSDTETSFDVVTVNRKTRTVYCTRIGAGEDRSISY